MRQFFRIANPYGDLLALRDSAIRLRSAQTPQLSTVQEEGDRTRGISIPGRLDLAERAGLGERRHVRRSSYGRRHASRRNVASPENAGPLSLEAATGEVFGGEPSRHRRTAETVVENSVTSADTNVSHRGAAPSAPASTSWTPTSMRSGLAIVLIFWHRFPTSTRNSRTGPDRGLLVGRSWKWRLARN